jgi:hypothetical protein
MEMKTALDKGVPKVFGHEVLYPHASFVFVRGGQFLFINLFDNALEIYVLFVDDGTLVSRAYVVAGCFLFELEPREFVVVLGFSILFEVPDCLEKIMEDVFLGLNQQGRLFLWLGWRLRVSLNGVIRSLRLFLLTTADIAHEYVYLIKILMTSRTVLRLYSREIGQCGA